MTPRDAYEHEYYSTRYPSLNNNMHRSRNSYHKKLLLTTFLPSFDSDSPTLYIIISPL